MQNIQNEWIESITRIMGLFHLITSDVPPEVYQYV